MNSELDQTLKAQVDTIAGQVEEIENLMESDCACMEILARIADVRAALGTLSIDMLTGYVKSCLAEASEPGTAQSEKQRRLAEVQAALHRLLQ
jgi:DNA-binding FrmR family transcriptional regulator